MIEALERVKGKLSHYRHQNQLSANSSLELSMEEKLSAEIDALQLEINALRLILTKKENIISELKISYAEEVLCRFSEESRFRLGQSVYYQGVLGNLTDLVGNDNMFSSDYKGKPYWIFKPLSKFGRETQSCMVLEESALLTEQEFENNK